MAQASSPVAPRVAMARSIALAAYVHGYPLIDMMRSGAMQTAPLRDDERPGSRMPVDRPTT